MPATEFFMFLSTVDVSVNRVTLTDLDEEILKQSMTQNRPLTLHELSK